MKRKLTDMTKRSIMLTVLFTTLSLICLCFFIPLSVASSSLTVEVRNQYTDGPISGAMVSISGPVSKSGVTGEDGRAVFSDLPYGTYDLVVSVEDFPNTHSHTIEVNGDTTTYVLFGFTKAYFTYSPVQALVNEAIIFNASSSTSSADITEFKWDFGDGTTATGATPTHVYNQEGSYAVVMTINSSVGTSTYTQQLNVAEPVINQIFWPWILLLIPLILIPLIWLLLARRRYSVVIKARVPTNP